MEKQLLLGTKQNMTQIFDEDGTVHPVTVIATGPMTVVQVKTVEKDGYSAVQMGFGEKREKNVLKAQKGHFKKVGDILFRYAREMRHDENTSEEKEGDIKNPQDIFSVGDTVTVSALSKAKGFQGVVKRHGFHGGPRTHGQKHTERSPGSIGSGLRSRVPKGMKMAGRTGGTRVTVKNLKVLRIDTDAGMVYVSGAVPGRRGTFVEIVGERKSA
jgi:large subunit ribosomal protein L3